MSTHPSGTNPKINPKPGSKTSSARAGTRAAPRGSKTPASIPPNPKPQTPIAATGGEGGSVSATLPAGAKPPKALSDSPPSPPRSTAQRRPNGDKPEAASRLSGLDAAARVLAESDKPLTCAKILEQIQQRNLWHTTGKTPGATLYAAIIREIAAKGDAARFRKVDRGLFEAVVPR